MKVTSGYYDNTVKLISEIEQGSITSQVDSVLEGANDTLGIILDDLNPERLESLKDSIQERFGQLEVCILFNRNCFFFMAMLFNILMYYYFWFFMTF